jgi:BirA family biotin operon repressor/biotin-[acetyl-CoA-carboxylase] ligase
MTIGSNIIFFETLPSTNTYATGLIRTKMVPEGTIIHAAFQSAGRGQTGNQWESEAGKNLLISIILYPVSLNPSDQFLISMMVSLGICDYLGGKISGCRIKWPNDIYVNNDKIAGILIENSIMENTILNSVAGIGLNINQLEFSTNVPNPISMSFITGIEYDPEVCLRQLAISIDKRYSQLMAGEHREIRRNYNSQLYRLNEWNDFSASGSLFRGRILSVKDDGMVRIERDDNSIREYSFSEVDFIL